MIQESKSLKYEPDSEPLHIFDSEPHLRLHRLGFMAKVRDFHRLGFTVYRATSLIRNSTPPQDHHRSLDIFLL